jgi:hypothetical protein
MLQLGHLAFQDNLHSIDLAGNPLVACYTEDAAGYRDAICAAIPKLQRLDGRLIAEYTAGPLCPSQGDALQYSQGEGSCAYRSSGHHTKGLCVIGLPLGVSACGVPLTIHRSLLQLQDQLQTITDGQ